MRRIGTISAAIGFIFLGVWMIISKSNPTLGESMFKWWPALIIILGIEVLVNYSMERPDVKRARVNLLIIPVIIIFLSVNTFQGVTNYFGDFSGTGFSFDNLIRWGENIDVRNYKEIDTTKVMDAFGKNFQFETDSGLIRFYKASDNKIKIVAKVYVNKGDERSTYNINEAKDALGYTILMKENYIKKVAADIYIPDGFIIGIVTASSSIKSSDNFPNSSYNIKTDSGNVELTGGQSLVLNIDSGTMKVVDIKAVSIKGDSGTISVSGNTDTLEAKLDSGTFNLDNSLCKNVNVELSSGIINVKTKDKNVNVSAQLDSGICTVNGDRRINSGVSKIVGNGEGKVRIKLNSGTIKYSSQE